MRFSAATPTHSATLCAANRGLTSVFSMLQDTKNARSAENILKCGGHLDLSKNCLASTHGLLELHTLISLDLSDNPLEEIHLLPPSLVALNMARTNLKQLYVSDKRNMQFSLLEGLSRLRQLVLAGNGIQNISSKAFEECQQLEFLDLSHNQIKNNLKSLTVLPKLMCLDLSYNKIEDIGEFKSFHSKELPSRQLCVQSNTFDSKYILQPYRAREDLQKILPHCRLIVTSNDQEAQSKIMDANAYAQYILQFPYKIDPFCAEDGQKQRFLHMTPPSPQMAQSSFMQRRLKGKITHTARKESRLATPTATTRQHTPTQQKEQQQECLTPPELLALNEVPEDAVQYLRQQGDCSPGTTSLAVSKFIPKSQPNSPRKNTQQSKEQSKLETELFEAREVILKLEQRERDRVAKDIEKETMHQQQLAKLEREQSIYFQMVFGEKSYLNPELRDNLQQIFSQFAQSYKGDVKSVRARYIDEIYSKGLECVLTDGDCLLNTFLRENSHSTPKSVWRAQPFTKRVHQKVQEKYLGNPQQQQQELKNTLMQDFKLIVDDENLLDEIGQCILGDQ